MSPAEHFTQSASALVCAMSSYLHNSDPINLSPPAPPPPLPPILYIKPGIYRGMHYWGMHYFSYFCSKTECRCPLEPPRRICSNKYPLSVLSRNTKNIFIFFEVKFSIYLNRRVFVTHSQNRKQPKGSVHSVASDLGLHCLLKPICPNN